MQVNDKLIILLVEDEPAILEVNRKLFEARGHEVISASNFTEAVMLLYSNFNRFVVALIDIHLSRLKGEGNVVQNLRDSSGLQLLEYIRDYASHYVVPLVYTGDATEEIAIKAYDIGVADVIAKGISPALLIAKVENNFTLPLAREAKVDKLTGLLNYHTFTHQVTRDLEGAMKGERRSDTDNFALIMIDADDFKKINEIYDHIVGDEAIRVIGEQIRQSTRYKDLCCRRSGDEFFVWLRSTTRDDALAEAVRLKRLVATSRVVDGEKNVEFAPSISFGIADINLNEIKDPEADLKRLMENAEAELKRFKASPRASRNRF